MELTKILAAVAPNVVSLCVYGRFPYILQLKDVKQSACSFGVSLSGQGLSMHSAIQPSSHLRRFTTSHPTRTKRVLEGQAYELPLEKIRWSSEQLLGNMDNMKLTCHLKEHGFPDFHNVLTTIFRYLGCMYMPVTTRDMTKPKSNSFTSLLVTSLSLSGFLWLALVLIELAEPVEPDMLDSAFGVQK